MSDSTPYATRSECGVWQSVLSGMLVWISIGQVNGDESADGVCSVPGISPLPRGAQAVTRSARTIMVESHRKTFIYFPYLYRFVQDRHVALMQEAHHSMLRLLQ
ncbi:MAG TPA: hypothetical protein VED37_15485 [Ktedonobacteraceae bacterium]|nr:hypothetical protein [Ktedonobacteraceae bacterium]